MKTILYLVIGYIIWKVIQIAARSLGNSRNRPGVDFDQQQRTTPQKFKDIQDAEFEELPPDKK
jgi:hypothetical protein